MFSKTDFQDWGKKNVVLFASVMTKIEGRQDDDLLRTYGFGGFPSFAILDAGGEAITKQMGRDLASMRGAAEAATAYQQLKSKREAGEEVDAAQWFLAELGLGKIKVDEAKAQLEKIKLSGADRTKAEGQILALELTELMKEVRQDPQGVAKSVYDLYKAGSRLPDGSQLTPFFAAMVLNAAKEAKDGKAFLWAYPTVKAQMAKQSKQYEEAAGKLREMGRDQVAGRYEQVIERIKTQIEELDSTAKSFEQEKEAGDAGK